MTKIEREGATSKSHLPWFKVVPSHLIVFLLSESRQLDDMIEHLEISGHYGSFRKSTQIFSRPLSHSFLVESSRPSNHFRILFPLFYNVSAQASGAIHSLKKIAFVFGFEDPKAPRGL